MYLYYYTCTLVWKCPYVTYWPLFMHLNRIILLTPRSLLHSYKLTFFQVMTPCTYAKCFVSPSSTKMEWIYGLKSLYYILDSDFVEWRVFKIECSTTAKFVGFNSFVYNAIILHHTPGIGVFIHVNYINGLADFPCIINLIVVLITINWIITVFFNIKRSYI